MKTVILAGGLGTRLAEFTEALPKPMVPIGGMPIIWHIMQIYAHFGYKDFYLPLGYKPEVVKDYFLNYHALANDFSVDLSSGSVMLLESSKRTDWNVTLVDTGLDTMTGGRLKRLKHLIADGRFMLTYGDGVANIDISKLVAQHEKCGKLLTVTAVRPPARFGDLQFSGDLVTSFAEKSQLGEGWINGGFMVVEPDFLDLIVDDSQMLEREPITRAVEMGEVAVYEHKGFWQCMDTKRDKDSLEALWKNTPPWIF